MRLICYPTSGEPPTIIPAPVDRTWMDQTPNGHAYRCLPLNIANAHGWMILNTAPFVAEWNGGAPLNAVTVQPVTEGEAILGESHFGSGVLTFHVNGLFRTEPGYDLMVTGPINMLKDAIQPLTGIVETDWAPFTFTMNWRFTRPRTKIAFARDEPFCMIYPIKRGMIDSVEPEIRPIETDPEINETFVAWSRSRNNFNQGLLVPGSEARAQKWQKDYFRGDTPYAEAPPDHRTKLRPRPFTIIRRWKQDGLMDQLIHEQTDENRSGRQRLLEGVLTSTAETARITPDMEIEPDALDFICQPDFLTADECAMLADATLALTRPASDTAGDDELVSDHVALFADIVRERPDAAALMRAIQKRVNDRLTQFYDLTVPLFTDSAQLIRLSEGMSVDPRAARAHPDGSSHPTPHRDFASIIYLNDNHEGGEVYFPRLDLVVKPGAGMLLAFTGGWHHEHGLTEVATGEQLTMAAFHTFDSRFRAGELGPPNGSRVPAGQS
jgi:Family of unknown function (DUF6065)/2OG-Fe(II) oxygenase superfamily